MRRRALRYRIWRRAQRTVADAALSRPATGAVQARLVTDTGTGIHMSLRDLGQLSTTWIGSQTRKRTNHVLAKLPRELLSASLGQRPV